MRSCGWRQHGGRGWSRRQTGAADQGEEGIAQAETEEVAADDGAQALGGDVEEAAREGGEAGEEGCHGDDAVEVAACRGSVSSILLSIRLETDSTHL